MFKKLSQFILMFAIITGWIFSGWPQIFNFPPDVQQVRAATCGTPTITLAAGPYTGIQSTTITGGCSGGTICYTTDGTTPTAPVAGTCSGGTTQTYSSALTIDHTETIKAIGTKSKNVNSTAASSVYTITVDTPTFGTNGGSFSNDTTSTILDAFIGATICYTTDGSTPGASTPGTCNASPTQTYSIDVPITVTGTVLKAIGTIANATNSSLATSNTFTLTVGAISSSPGAGTYGSAQNVTLNIDTTTGAVAHYTTDGSAVSCSSATYSGAFNISTTATVKAIGCKTNYVSDTPISDLYTLNLNSAPSFSGNPTDSPDPVVTGRNVTFSGTATDSADNWYLAVCKTDSITPGSPPTCAADQTLCVSSSAVGTGSQNTCAWTSTGSVAQDWYAFACDNNASPLCSSANVVNSPITVNAPVISISIETGEGSFDYGKMNFEAASSTLTLFGGTGITAINDGNVIETFYINGANTACPWTLVTGVPSTDQYRHQFCNMAGGCSSYPTNYTAMTTAYLDNVLATDIAASGGTVDFQLRITAPSSTSCFSAQNADITIVAVEQ